MRPRQECLGSIVRGRVQRTDDGLRVTHWPAPGREAVYRVDSEAIRRAKIEVM